MISNREIDSTIDTSEVKNMFNKKYRWKKYNAVYHAPITYYHWDRYQLEYTISRNSNSGISYPRGSVQTFYSSCVFNANTKTFDVSGAKTITIATKTSGDPNAPIGLYSVTIGDQYYRNTSLYLKGIYLDTDDSLGYSLNVEEITYSKGTAYGSVSSTSRSAYPDNRRKNGYWYVYSRSSTTAGYYTKGSYVEDVEAKEENAYPSNGRHSDGYWYVKVE